MSINKYLKIFIILATIISISILGIMFLKSKETSSLKQQKYIMGNTSGNIINNGLAAQGKGYIYYSNTSDKNRLYRMKEDGSYKKKLSNDSCSFINVVDEWIYYRNNDDGGKIYKIKTDGTMRTCLNKDDSTYVTVVGDFIYYCDSLNNNQITRIEKDGLDRKVICKDSAEFINISDGWIYYSNTSENYSLYKVSMDGKGRTLISKDMCYFLNVSGDWIFYVNYSRGFNLYKIKINGQDNMVLDNESVDSVNVCDNWIYFYAKNNDNKQFGLYKMKFDGTGKQIICYELSQKLNTSFNWVFYINPYDKNLLYKVKPDGTMRQSNDETTVVRSMFDLNSVLMTKIPYEIDNDKLKETYEKAKEIVKELIKPGMTDLEKELVLHNYIVSHSSYDSYYIQTGIMTEDSASPYGVLVKGVGVCWSYAEALKLLLNLSNIECELLIGEIHVWDIVKIDGEYYHIDTTWDDSASAKDNHSSLKYFNQSDNVIKDDHTWEKSNYKACNNDRFLYFRSMDFPTYHDGWFYYSNSADKNRLYKMRIDGSDKKKLSNDNAKYILVNGKYIYFSNCSKHGYLYRTDINGKGEKQLNSENCKTITIENNILKYTNDSGHVKTMKVK